MTSRSSPMGAPLWRLVLLLWALMAWLPFALSYGRSWSEALLVSAFAPWVGLAGALAWTFVGHSWSSRLPGGVVAWWLLIGPPAAISPCVALGDDDTAPMVIPAAVWFLCACRCSGRRRQQPDSSAPS